MRTQFQDRTEAGKLLAEKLTAYAGRPDVLVLGLPRGGVPVGYEIARRLEVPLDVFIVRKLGVPGHEELAMGAIASGGIRVLNRDVVDALGITDRELEAATQREQAELQRRERAFRDDRSPPELTGRVVILVDDGIATGSTMHAAVAAIRDRNPARIIVAVPTAAPSSYAEFHDDADEVVAVMTPEPFYGVGQWYVNFTQTTDSEVRNLLSQAQALAH